MKCFLRIKGFILFVLMLVCFGTSMAQQNHFVYLQTEDSKPFYIKLNNKLISSSDAGYLILPEMTDGDYKISVGFPRSSDPEIKFDIGVQQKNYGYLLKNLSDKGWVLFNMQNLDLIAASGNNTQSTDVATQTVTKKVVDDPFSTMLASAVKDSSILQTIVKNQESTPSKPAEKPVIARDTASSVAAQSVTAVDVTSSDIQATPNTKKGEMVKNTSVPDTIFITDTQYVKGNDAIKKILAEKANGSDVTYAVKTSEGVDTIRVEMVPVENDKKIIIPESSTEVARDSMVYEKKKNEEPIQYTITPTAIPKDTTRNIEVESPHATVPKTEEVLKDTTATIKEPEKKSEIKVDPAHNADAILEANRQAEKEARKENETPVSRKKDEMTVLPQAVTSSAVNSDCKDFATDQDFLKLRKRMASQTSDDRMINEARKYFKLKCFSTDQLRDLSFLFRSDEGKYLFLDAAYAFTSDSDRYAELQTLFQDGYYLNRFKALVGL